jgi:DNA-binding CsgD family transcriptional regulator
MRKLSPTQQIVALLLLFAAVAVTLAILGGSSTGMTGTTAATKQQPAAAQQDGSYSDLLRAASASKVDALELDAESGKADVVYRDGSYDKVTLPADNADLLRELSDNGAHVWIDGTTGTGAGSEKTSLVTALLPTLLTLGLVVALVVFLRRRAKANGGAGGGGGMFGPNTALRASAEVTTRWARALAARCRAVSSDGAGAEEHFASALDLHAPTDRRFDRARTELLYGEFLRRERRRLEARTHLRTALEAFEQMDARSWAERAGGELRATGETARKRDPGTLAQLTPQELQIARLVAEGRSNKDVAAQLFLSPRTIDYHLRKVFMKLGITSRAELIRDGVVGELRPAVAS